MANLSPAAQAVYDAATTAAIHDNADWPVAIAAALRAAATQSDFADVAVNKTVEVVLVDHLLAIAAELEGHRPNHKIYTL